MGALATFAPWTPEDDLLLKNAVEAGASLESLAKGAVQFSRRYSVREIQDRWYSLLYDPIISAEASACMSNFELSASPLPSKFIKFGHPKERKIVSVKRKAESVRTSYYAMRKRICNDTFTSMDLSFLVEPEHGNYVVNGSEPLPENCLPEGAASNHCGFRGSNFDPVHYGFPENMMDSSVASNGVTAHTLYTGVEDPVEEKFPVEQKNVLKEESQILGDNVSLNGAVEELGVPKELVIDSLTGDNNLESMPLSTFDQVNNDPGNLCCEFDGNNAFDSSDLECGTSFNNLQLSPLPEMPIWRTDDSIQEPDMSCDDFEDSIACGEAYLEQLSNSLLNFSNEDELYLMDVDGKDGFDKSYYDGLSSLLLNSPNDVSPDQMPKKAETETLMAAHAHITNLSVSCHSEVDDNVGSHPSDVQMVRKLDVQMPSSASAKDPRFPELVNGAICCTFNTEDPEIPSNDDVFLPFDVPPSTVSSSWSFRDSNKPISSSVRDFECSTSNHRPSERGKIQAEQKTPGESHVSSQMMVSHPLPRPIGGSKVNCVLPNNHASHMVSRSVVFVSSGSGGNNSANTSTNVLIHGNPKEEATNVGLAKHISNHRTSSFCEKPALGSNDFRNHHQPNGSGMKQEQDLTLPIQDPQLQHAEVGSTEVLGSEQVANPPTLDEEEQYIESDDDVPYYSDIEAMILDMDLDPDDQDLHYCEEVSRYQDEDTKRAIIRLEQGAHSYMQRAIASYGAFAILYGRNTKHYIKKPEVLLGRATEGVPVDIDLGKGGHANKISRRQAIIKIDKDGSFYLRNLGKSSILVNNEEVHTGQSQRLHSSCLIELRGMPFIFETNQNRVKQYLHHITDNNKTL